MKTKTKPEFITEGDGVATITLASSATIGGQRVKHLTMREPCAGDLKVARTAKGDDAEIEARLFANLLEITPDEVAALTLRNYKRVAAAFEVFTE